jgi:hypothetical protein
MVGFGIDPVEPSSFATRSKENCSEKFTTNKHEHMYVVTCIFVAWEQLGKHVPVKKNSWPTIGKGLSIARQREVNKFSQ